MGGDDFLDNIAHLDDKRPTRQPTQTPTVTLEPGAETQRRRRYAEAALAKEIDTLTHAPEGTRNHTLNRSAFNLLRFVGEHILTEEEVRYALTEAALSAGLTINEITATLNSAQRGSQDKPRQQPAVPPATNHLTATTIEAPPTGEDTTFRFVDGASFILDIPDTIPALWGEGEDILWSDGESLMIAGPMGLGKTTLAGQLIAAQIGITDPTCLGLPVTPRQRVLYLAMDRPAQIARAMARQFGAQHRDILAERLIIWKGPPPADIARNPMLLNKLAELADADTVYVDSLKDAAIGLSEDEVGAGYNRARQNLLAHECQLCELHHTVKRGMGGGAPNHVADVYGSAWLTNGTGSIILLGGEPGDPIVSFKHPRQPAAEVGPYQLLHDQTAGIISIHHSTSLLDMAANAGPEGLTAKGAAAALFDAERPTRGQIEKARRKLDSLAADGLIVACDGPRTGTGRPSTVWFPAARKSS